MSPPKTKRKRTKPPSKIVLSESGDDEPQPSVPPALAHSALLLRQRTPLFLPDSSDGDPRRHHHHSISDFGLRLVPVDPQAPNPSVVMDPSAAPLPSPREPWVTVAPPVPSMDATGPLTARSSRAGRARRASFGTQLRENQMYETPVLSLPASGPAVFGARDGHPPRLDLSQLGSRRWRAPRRGPMGIVQNFPTPAETPRSTSPATDVLLLQGVVPSQPPATRQRSPSVVAYSTPPLAAIASGTSSPAPSLHLSPSHSGTPPHRRVRDKTPVIGMEAKPFPPARQHRIVGMKSWPSNRRPPAGSSSSESRSSSSPESGSDSEAPPGCDARSESTQESLAVAPLNDVEPDPPTRRASPARTFPSEAAFKGDLIPEANPLEPMQLQREPRAPDFVTPPAAHETEDAPPPARNLPIQTRASLAAAAESAALSRSASQLFAPEPDLAASARSTPAPVAVISVQPPGPMTRSAARAAASTQAPAAASAPAPVRSVDHSTDAPPPAKKRRIQKRASPAVTESAALSRSASQLFPQQPDVAVSAPPAPVAVISVQPPGPMTRSAARAAASTQAPAAASAPAPARSVDHSTDAPPPAKERRIQKRASPAVTESAALSRSASQLFAPRPDLAASASPPPGPMTRSASLAAGSTQAPAAAPPAPSVDHSTPVTRKSTRPTGSKDQNPAKRQGKAKGKGKPLRSRLAPGTEMAGPLPVGGGSSSRSGPFDFPLPVPPMDVDGLQRVLTHDVLQPSFGGCDFCLVHDFRCDEGRPGLECSPCLSRRWPCPNLNSVEQRMGFHNRLGLRFANLSNDNINNIVYQMNQHGDNAMAALELARSSQREYVRYQGLLGRTMAEMSYGYGDASGVAYAAEISPEQREQFAEYWTAGELSLPPRPPPAGARLRDAPPHRRAWARVPFKYFAQLDERNDPEVPVPTLNTPGGDPGQGSLRRDTRDQPAPSFSENESGHACEQGEKENSERGPPSPPAPYGS